MTFKLLLLMKLNFNPIKLINCKSLLSLTKEEIYHKKERDYSQTCLFKAKPVTFCLKSNKFRQLVEKQSIVQLSTTIKKNLNDFKLVLRKVYFLLFSYKTLDVDHRKIHYQHNVDLNQRF